MWSPPWRRICFLKIWRCHIWISNNVVCPGTPRDDTPAPYFTHAWNGGRFLHILPLIVKLYKMKWNCEMTQNDAKWRKMTQNYDLLTGFLRVAHHLLALSSTFFYRVDVFRNKQLNPPGIQIGPFQWRTTFLLVWSGNVWSFFQPEM